MSVGLNPAKAIVFSLLSFRSGGGPVLQLLNVAISINEGWLASMIWNAWLYIATRIQVVELGVIGHGGSL